MTKERKKVEVSNVKKGGSDVGKESKMKKEIDQLRIMGKKEQRDKLGIE